ncbi:hypothetical protein HDV02_003222 [Globomyces sp. JEL0801]|nr:hypothetical protein HDV02_003222 [Globomyces sp. JEL0801]
MNILQDLESNLKSVTNLLERSNKNSKRLNQIKIQKNIISKDTNLSNTDELELINEKLFNIQSKILNQQSQLLTQQQDSIQNHALKQVDQLYQLQNKQVELQLDQIKKTHQLYFKEIPGMIQSEQNRFTASRSTEQQQPLAGNNLRKVYSFGNTNRKNNSTTNLKENVKPHQTGQTNSGKLEIEIPTDITLLNRKVENINETVSHLVNHLKTNQKTKHNEDDQAGSDQSNLFDKYLQDSKVQLKNDKFTSVLPPPFDYKKVENLIQERKLDPNPKIDFKSMKKIGLISEIESKRNNPKIVQVDTEHPEPVFLKKRKTRDIKISTNINQMDQAKNTRIKTTLVAPTRLHRPTTPLRTTSKNTSKPFKVTFEAPSPVKKPTPRFQSNEPIFLRRTSIRPDSLEFLTRLPPKPYISKVSQVNGENSPVKTVREQSVQVEINDVLLNEQKSIIEQPVRKNSPIITTVDESLQTLPVLQDHWTQMSTPSPPASIVNREFTSTSAKQKVIVEPNPRPVQTSTLHDMSEASATWLQGTKLERESKYSIKASKNPVMDFQNPSRFEPSLQNRLTEWIRSEVILKMASELENKNQSQPINDAITEAINPTTPEIDKEIESKPPSEVNRAVVTPPRKILDLMESQVQVNISPKPTGTEIAIQTDQPFETNTNDDGMDSEIQNISSISAPKGFAPTSPIKKVRDLALSKLMPISISPIESSKHDSLTDEISPKIDSPKFDITSEQFGLYLEEMLSDIVKRETVNITSQTLFEERDKESKLTEVVMQQKWQELRRVDEEQKRLIAEIENSKKIMEDKVQVEKEKLENISKSVDVIPQVPLQASPILNQLPIPVTRIDQNTSPIQMSHISEDQSKQISASLLTSEESSLSMLPSVVSKVDQSSTSDLSLTISSLPTLSEGEIITHQGEVVQQFSRQTIMRPLLDPRGIKRLPDPKSTRDTSSSDPSTSSGQISSSGEISILMSAHSIKDTKLVDMTNTTDSHSISEDKSVSHSSKSQREESSNISTHQQDLLSPEKRSESSFAIAQADSLGHVNSPGSHEDLSLTFERLSVIQKDQHHFDDSIMED